MKANELMIGDLVNFHCFDESTIFAKVTEIHNDIIYGKHITNIWGNSKDIEPIPLTSEILEKNGFILNTHVYPYPVYDLEDLYMLIRVAFPEGKSTKYRVPFVEIDTKNCFVEHIEIKYVHQLQHALRLCGIDKEIIL